MTYPGGPPPNGISRRFAPPDPLSPTPGGPLRSAGAAGVDPLNPDVNEPGSTPAPPRNPLDWVLGMVPGVFYGQDPAFDQIQAASSRGGLAAGTAMLRGSVDQAKNIGMQMLYRSRIGDVADAVTLATGRDMIANQEMTGLDRYLFGGLALAAAAIVPFAGIKYMGQATDQLVSGMHGSFPGMERGRGHLRDLSGNVPLTDSVGLNVGIAKAMYASAFAQGAQSLSHPTDDLPIGVGAPAPRGLEPGTLFDTEAETGIGPEAGRRRVAMEGPGAPTSPTVEQSIGQRIGGAFSRAASRVVGLASPENVGNTAWSLSPRFQDIMGLFVHPRWDEAARRFSVLADADTPDTLFRRQDALREIGYAVSALPHHAEAGADAMKGLTGDMAGQTPELSRYTAAVFALSRIDRLLEIPRSLDWTAGKTSAIHDGPDTPRTGVFGHNMEDFTEAYHLFTRGELDIRSDQGKQFVRDITELEGFMGFGIPVHAQLDPSYLIGSIDRSGEGFMMGLNHNVRNHHRNGHALRHVYVNDWIQSNGKVNETLVPHLAMGPTEFLERALAEVEFMEQTGLMGSEMRARIREDVDVARTLAEVRSAVSWYPAMHDLMESMSMAMAEQGVRMHPHEIAAMVAALSRNADWEQQNIPAVFTMLSDMRVMEAAIKNPQGTAIPHGFTDLTPFLEAIRSRVPDFPTDPQMNIKGAMSKLLEMGQMHVAFDAWKEAYPDAYAAARAQPTASKRADFKTIGQLPDNVEMAVRSIGGKTPLIPEAEMQTWLGADWENRLKPGQVYTEGGELTGWDDRSRVLAEKYGVVRKDRQTDAEAYLDLRSALFKGSNEAKQALIVPINGGIWGFNPAAIQMTQSGGRWNYKYDITGDKLRNFLINVGYGRLPEFESNVTIDRWATRIAFGFKGADTDNADTTSSYQMHAAAEIIRGKLAGLEPKRLQSLEWVFPRLMKDLGPNEAYHNVVHEQLRHRHNPMQSQMGIYVNDETTLDTTIPLPTQAGSWYEGGHPGQYTRHIRMTPTGIQVFAPVTRRMSRLMPNMVPTNIVVARHQDKRIPDMVVWVTREQKRVRNTTAEINRLRSEKGVSAANHYANKRFLRHSAGRQLIRVSALLNPQVGEGAGEGIADIDSIYSRANALQWMFNERRLAARVRVDGTGHQSSTYVVSQPRLAYIRADTAYQQLGGRDQAAVERILGVVDTAVEAELGPPKAPSQRATQVAQAIYRAAVGVEDGSAMMQTKIPTLDTTALDPSQVVVTPVATTKHDIWIEPESPSDMDAIIEFLHEDARTVTQSRVGLDAEALNILEKRPGRGKGRGRKAAQPVQLTFDPSWSTRKLEPARLDTEEAARAEQQSLEWQRKGKGYWNLMDLFFNDEALDYAVYSPEPDAPGILRELVGTQLAEADEHVMFDGDNHGTYYTAQEIDTGNGEGTDVPVHPYAIPVLVGRDSLMNATRFRDLPTDTDPLPQPLGEGITWGNSFEVAQIAPGILADSYGGDRQTQIGLVGTAGPLDVEVRSRGLIGPGRYDEPADPAYGRDDARPRSGYWTQNWQDGVVRLYRGTKSDWRKMGQIEIKGEKLTATFGDTVPEAEQQAVYDRLLRNWVAANPDKVTTVDDVAEGQRHLLPEDAQKWVKEAAPTHFAIWMGEGRGEVTQIAYDTDQIVALLRRHLGAFPDRYVLGQIEWSKSGHPARVILGDSPNPGMYARGYYALVDAGADPASFRFRYPDEGIDADGNVVPITKVIPT